MIFARELLRQNFDTDGWHVMDMLHLIGMIFGRKSNWDVPAKGANTWPIINNHRR